MGQLIYGNAALVLDFDDRTLAHLQLVISAKLRRRESFWLTWANLATTGSGRESIWLDSHIPLRFSYSVPTAFQLSRAWVELLTTIANSAAGLYLVPEPVADIESAQLPAVARAS